MTAMSSVLKGRIIAYYLNLAILFVNITAVLKGRIIAYYLNIYGPLDKVTYVLKGRIIAYYLNFQENQLNVQLSLRVELLRII